MKYPKYPSLLLILAVVSAILLALGSRVQAATAAELNRKARQALQDLYAASPAARHAGDHARAVLVFPEIIKGGFVIGGQHGDGTLFFDGRGHPIGHYKTVAASYGLQAGVQKFGYALFFMTDNDLAYLRKSGGWEVGSGPSLVIVDRGMAKSLTSTTLRKGVYAFAFGQKGLMAGLGLQ